MANPQTENGYTKIANEILEKLSLFDWPEKTGIPCAICFFVIRKTYGYQKKEDHISLTQFEKGLNSNRPTIVHWLKYLVKARLLVKASEPAGRQGYLWQFNKDWEQWAWGVKASELVKARVYTSKGALTKTSKGALTHKRNKEKNTKEMLRPEVAGKIEDEVNLIFKEFYETINPNINYANKSSRDAALWLINRYSFEKTINACRYAVSVQGKQYAPTITTPSQLKNKMAELVIYQKKQGQESKTINLNNL